jgi:hypothetical protein
MGDESTSESSGTETETTVETPDGTKVETTEKPSDE